jgi:hypothetical protein
MKFETTEEAVAYGEGATAKDITRLITARAAYISQCKALAKGPAHAKSLQKRIQLITLAQFCREAIEASKQPK